MRYIERVATVTHGDYEWDEDKASENLVKHGVAFEEAATVLSSALTAERPDPTDPGKRAPRRLDGARRSDAYHQRSQGDGRGAEGLRARVTDMAKTAAATKVKARRAKPLAPKQARTSADEISELTPEQIAGAKRRGPERFAKGYPALPLETIRKGAGLTQNAVSAAASMTQPEVARLEGRDTLEGVRIETLRRYVEGLGGKLELVATFPTGHRIGLAGAPRVKADGG